jgi:hypothetical protein
MLLTVKQRKQEDPPSEIEFNQYHYKSKPYSSFQLELLDTPIQSAAHPPLVSNLIGHYHIASGNNI